MRPLRTAALAALAAALTAAGCFSEHADAGPTDPSTAVGSCRIPVATTSGGVQAIVAIKNFSFVTDTLRIPRGTTVAWVNCEEGAGAEAHTATSDGRVWDSALLAPEVVYTRRFDQAGTFPYHCEPHPFMRGTVVVE